MKQLFLELAPPARPTFDNFVTGDNFELVQVLRDIAKGQLKERVVYMWGESGAGKSHLLDAIYAAANIPLIAVRNGAIPQSALEGSVVTVDDVHLLNEENQIGLFNLINVLQNATLVATGPCAPRDLGLRRDLATRLGSGLVYLIHGLTDDDKRSALAAHARSRGFSLNDEIITYLLRHARRDMPSLMAILDALDRYSLQTGRAITLPLLKDALQPR